MRTLLMSTALRDTDANVRSLRRYILQFSRSKQALRRFEVLPESITRSMESFSNDVLAVKKLLPSKPVEKLEEKVQWVFNKKKAEGLMQRFNERNNRLVAALEITRRCSICTQY